MSGTPKSQDWRSNARAVGARQAPATALALFPLPTQRRRNVAGYGYLEAAFGAAKAEEFSREHVAFISEHEPASATAQLKALLTFAKFLVTEGSTLARRITHAESLLVAPGSQAWAEAVYTHAWYLWEGAGAKRTRVARLKTFFRVVNALAERGLVVPCTPLSELVALSRHERIVRSAGEEAQ